MYRWIEAKGLPAHRIGKLWKLKLGTTQQWHQMAPNPWVIIGMLPVPFQKQLGLFT